MPTHTTSEIIAVLRAHGLDAQPHNLGLAAHTNDPERYAQALMACNPTTLRVLTMNSNQGVPQQDCRVDPMICECATHTAERTEALRRAPRHITQPWETRPSRHAT